MISIILPTYNERDNICNTIESLLKILKKKFSFEIIVVDDDSPDKTWDLVNKKYKKDSEVRVIRRVGKKKGLAPSVIDGFKSAKGDLLIVADADGQHDLSKIPELVSKSKKADIVIGSRFIPGGSVEGWSKKRIFISKTAALMSRPFLDQKVSDPMSGFFLIKKDWFNKIKDRLHPEGYKILLEILFASPKAKVEEVAFKFGLREHGESKLSQKVIFEYLKMLLRQAWNKYGKFIRFCIVGLSGVFVNLGILYSLTEFVGIYYVYSSIIAVEISIITNFILDNFWTWKADKKGFFKRFLKFNLISLVSLSINVGIIFLLTEVGNLWYIISNLVGIGTATIFNFWFNDKWTFEKNE